MDYNGYPYRTIYNGYSLQKSISKYPCIGQFIMYKTCNWSLPKDPVGYLNRKCHVSDCDRWSHKKSYDNVWHAMNGMNINGTDNHPIYGNYMVTFTINIPPMLAYRPYMVRIGMNIDGTDNFNVR